MSDWHDNRLIDLGLRLSGAALWGLAWLSAQSLADFYPARTSVYPSSGGFALAAAAFLCGSLGGILLTLGKHVFDRIEIDRRWRSATSRSSRGERAPAPSVADMKMMADRVGFEPTVELPPR